MSRQTPLLSVGDHPIFVLCCRKGSNSTQRLQIVRMLFSIWIGYLILRLSVQPRWALSPLLSNQWVWKMWVLKCLFRCGVTLIDFSLYSITLKTITMIHEILRVESPLLWQFRECLFFFILSWNIHTRIPLLKPCYVCGSGVQDRRGWFSDGFFFVCFLSLCFICVQYSLQFWQRIIIQLVVKNLPPQDTAPREKGAERSRE